MKKKELLAMRRLSATPDMVRAAREDTCIEEQERWRDRFGTYRTFTRRHYNYYLYFRACIEHEILKVAVFVREWLIRGKTEPQFEIYLAKSEQRFLTYDTTTGKWREAKIDMLDFDFGKEYSYLYSKRNYQSEGTRRLVNEYLGTGNRDVKEAVLDFQYQIRREELQKKHRSDIEAIDAVMNEVPEIPKEFEKWVMRNCFQEYLLYRRKGKNYEAYCTHCGRWETLNCQPVHNGRLYCRTCGCFYPGKAWGRQKCLTEERGIGMLQRLRDGSGYILRDFVCKIKRSRETEWKTPEFHYYEDRRVRLSKSFVEEEFYEYGEYKNTGVNRWCRPIRRGYYGFYASRYFGRVLMYTPNLKRELRNERFVHVDLKKLMKGGERETVEPARLLRILHRYPFVEYLWKTGLNRLAGEIMNGEEREELFFGDADRLTMALKLDKQRLRRLKEWDGGCNVLAALQEEVLTGSRITDENIRYIQENEIDPGKLQRHRTGMNLQRTLNYLKKQQEQTGMEFVTLIRYYKDYLDMAEERGMDLTDEIVCRNHRMMEYHNRYLEEKNAEEEKKRDREVNRKYPKIKKRYEQNRAHFAWKDEEYTVLVPRRASDITGEGRLQHHCVGTGSYMQKMNEGTTYILFLRRQKDLNQPWYTLEVTWEGKVIQKYAAYDRQPEIEKVERILVHWKKEIEKRLQKERQKESRERVAVYA